MKKKQKRVFLVALLIGFDENIRRFENREYNSIRGRKKYSCNGNTTRET